MEVRLAADLTSGSFDKSKAERFAQMGAANVKQENAVAQHKFDEIYEGRAYAKDDFVQFAVGCFRGDTFYISPIAGTFDMHRSLAHLNNAGKGAHDDEARVVATDDLAKLVDPSISRSELIDYLKECAHLVQGVWVLQSAFLYHDLTAANASAPGKLDEYRADLWRQARDLALCLLDAGLPVTRSLLTRCFQINSKDAEDILSSFAVPGNRSWKLRITPDPVFVESPDNVQIVLEERRYWAERWEELQRKIDSTMPSPRHSSRARKNSSRGSPTKSPPTRVRRNSTRGSPSKQVSS
ncbi:unnamed protein product [Nippostrongylus brasiliensis]|uniref:Nucleotidyltransferase n=1 Tax=Nippostrongylus brasiliensis TaxID=27835 RepID=A0A0N4XHE3_NIPBR|nr:unnamed protein product [Nippostrongylus brasiliensis]